MTKKQQLKHEFLMSWLKRVELSRPQDAGERWVREYNLQEVDKRLNDLLQLKLVSFKNPTFNHLTTKTNDII